MRKTLLSLATALLLALAPSAEAKIAHLLPKPQQLTATGETPFSLGRAVRVNDATGNTALLRFLEETGCTVDASAAAVINVSIVDEVKGTYDYALAGFPAEGYKITVGANEINIEALTETGVIRAAQTLTQLAEGYDGTAAIEALEITDWPAFKLRGYMHDIGRSFIEFETLKKHIDLLSRFKVNVFHFHLTENQAWRFEVKKYPQLTAASSMTRFAGKYYTQEQCAELEAYAAERGVIIIPEIDMPGHSQAFKTAMGHSMQTDEGVEELKNILDEVAAVFKNAPYIHIGADEETISYPDFLRIMTDKVHALGKKVVVWNPIRGVSISKNAGFDMTQMWSTSGTKVAGIPNIDCRYNYTNHFDVFADLVGIYKSSIYYQDKGSAEVAGTISAYWNDRKTPTEEDIVKQNNMYANVLASAERAWIGGGEQYIEQGGTTLPNSGKIYDEFKDWETRFLFHKSHSLKNEPIPYVKQTNIRWCITDAFPNGGNASLQLPPETEGLKDSYTYNGNTYGTGMATGGGIYLRHTWGNIIPTYFSNPQENTTAYAWTYIYSPVEQTAGALIEFQNYGRSEKDAAPNAGKWDRRGSRIWLNDAELLPPKWKNSGKSINNEVDLLNENFTARDPEVINLKQGWNKVFIKLPNNPNGLRLNKWAFTFVVTDLEGKNALEGLIYSPNKCMDEAAEQVAATLSELKKLRSAVVGTNPGYYPESCAAELDAVIEKVEATLQDEMSADERAQQQTELAEARADFEAYYPTQAINQPQISDEAHSYFYYMCTPLREGRYPTAKGAGADIVGEKNTSEAAAWKFVRRTDGSYDIMNFSDGTYVSPASSNNTALRTVTARPNKGWTIKPANEPGFVIITSGSAQFNQTNNSSLGYKVYNWGSGTNTDDTGCKYKITPAEDLPELPDEVDLPEPLLVLTNISLDGSSPFRIPDVLAAPVLSASEITVAVDFTLANNNKEMTLVGSSNSAKAEEFVCFNVASANNIGVRYNNSGGRYTSSTNIGTARHQFVATMQEPSPSIQHYLDGSHLREVGAAVYTFGSVPNVNGLYLGGIVCSDNANKYPMTGTLHSVQFFPGVLNAAQVSRISYTGLVPTSIESITSNCGADIRIVGNRIICNGAYEVYNAAGRRMQAQSTFSPGIYIVRTAVGAFKVAIR